MSNKKVCKIPGKCDERGTHSYVTVIRCFNCGKDTTNGEGGDITDDGQWICPECGYTASIY